MPLTRRSFIQSLAAASVAVGYGIAGTGPSAPKLLFGICAGPDKARWAVYLGNLAQVRKQRQDATKYYQEALTLAAGKNADIEFGAQLNLARLSAPKQRLEMLTGISTRLSAASGQRDLARHHLNLGNQMRLLGAEASPLAFRHLDTARNLAQQSGDRRLLAESQNTLAQLYEDKGRHNDALILNERATELARSLPAGLGADLLINLEWRQGRLLRRQG
jgi:tetratricopeptide (TPR) repeat protein